MLKRGLASGIALTMALVLGNAQADVSQPQWIPGQYIVELSRGADGLTVSELAGQLAAQYGGQVVHTYEHAYNGFAVRLPAAQAALLAMNPAVVHIEQDQVMHAIGTQSGATWGIDRSDQRTLPLDGVYSYPAQGGQGVHVYVIDTGINASHAEFTGRVGTSRNFVPGLFGFGSVDPADWDDCNGHGTHVSSSAVGTTWGIAKQATIHAVRVLDCQGSGGGADILAGIDWVAANHQSPAVANLSLGTLTGRSQAQEDAVANLVDANVAVAVAAGNDNVNACNTSPAAEPTVLTVGATTNTDARASFSNYGTCLDLFAPGNNIVAANYSNNSGSTTMSGTSMASPHVAGALALVRGASPALNAAQAQSQLVTDTTPNVVSNPGTGSPNKLLYVVNGGTPPPADNPPIAAFTFNCTDLACSFDGSSSTDDHGIAAYSWTFGDSTSGNGATVSHTYAAGGTYNVTLTVTDTVSQTDGETKSVTVTAPGGGGAPCTDCQKFSGSLSSGGTAYYTSSSGFSSPGGAFNGYLRGPSNADFDLYLEKQSCLFVCTWGSVASAESTGSDEDISYTGTSGTYRWRVKSYSGSGSYDFYMDNP